MKFQKILASVLVLLIIAASVYLMFPYSILDPVGHNEVDPSQGNTYGQTSGNSGTDDGGKQDTGSQPVELIPDNNIDQKQETGQIIYTVEDLKDLKNLDHFRESTIEHLFLGTINDSGKATGYHYNGIKDTPGEIIPGTESEPDRFGVYTAKVRVNGTNKSGNNGYSSFFPDSMSPQDVIDAINEAYENRVEISDSLYAGLTDEGMEIDMVVNKKGIITTAYPVKEGD